MSEVVIRAEGLGKRYLIGHEAAAEERHSTLRDVVSRQMKRLVRSGRDMARGRQIIAGDEVEEFWALKDVSFEIKRGEVVGIIGRNGAGKSTLLKILSRITEPSTGRVEIKGRVASLLEVGTGFHPELSGRENIFLNGAILGMSRSEIKRKFDEIVAFAEIEKFLDTPVKRYSSGMYVRLAFSVAAHLEPEILVVDEVLAVGDAEFQKKCLGKMQDVAGHGRTVLFVSHNMAAIKKLCSKTIVLESGLITEYGDTQKTINNFHHAITQGTPASYEIANSTTNEPFTARILSIKISGGQSKEITFLDPIEVNIGVETAKELKDLYFGFSVVNYEGVEILGSTARDGGAPSDLPQGVHNFTCYVCPNPLPPGRYVLRSAIFSKSETYQHISEALQFEVRPQTCFVEKTPTHMVGQVYLPFKWVQSKVI